MKPYDPVLDAQTKEILEPTYARILKYTDARRVKEEPENPDEYKSYDKICTPRYNPSLEWWWEFEVRDLGKGRRVWSGVRFVWNTVHVPGRKKDSKAGLYFNINPTGSAFAVTSMEHVKSSPLVASPAYNEEDMRVFDVSKSLWDFYLITQYGVELDEISDEERYLIPCPVGTPSIK